MKDNIKKYNYNDRKYYLFCLQREQPYGANWDHQEAYTLSEIKKILINYHLIDNPKCIKYYSLRRILCLFEWGIFLDKEMEKEINYNLLR